MKVNTNEEFIVLDVINNKVLLYTTDESQADEMAKRQTAWGTEYNVVVYEYHYGMGIVKNREFQMMIDSRN